MCIFPKKWQGRLIPTHNIPKHYIKNGEIYKTKTNMKTETKKIENLSEALETEKMNEINKIRYEIIVELWKVHEVLKVTGHGMKGRIGSIIEKMM
jgi:hypothetical protein